MESLFKPMKLSPETNRTLEEIRGGAENTLYCAESAVADKLFHEHVESLIEGAGLTSMQVIHYRWFLREIARLWRTRQGRDLAFHIELSLRKWKSLGLDARVIQFLVCECHERLKAQNLTTKHALSEVEGTPRHEENPEDSTTEAQSRRESEHSISRPLDPSVPRSLRLPPPRHQVTKGPTTRSLDPLIPRSLPQQPPRTPRPPSRTMYYER